MRVKAAEGSGVLLRLDVGARQHVGKGTLSCRGESGQTVLIESLGFFLGGHEFASLVPKLHSRLSAPGGQSPPDAVDRCLPSLVRSILRSVYQGLKTLLADPATGGRRKPLCFGKSEN